MAVYIIRVFGINSFARFSSNALNADFFSSAPKKPRPSQDLGLSPRSDFHSYVVQNTFVKERGCVLEMGLGLHPTSVTC